MGKRILELAQFFIERPALTGAMVWGGLYLFKKGTGKKGLSTEETAHVLEIYEKQRPYADTMYDLPDEPVDIAAASAPSKKS